MLKIDHISVRFPKPNRQSEEITVLDNISIDIAAGEIVTIVGPSGCGKSTLLNVIAGLITPSGGVVRLGNESVVGPRHDVSVVFQQPSLLPWRTVMRNVTFGLLARRLAGKDEALVRAAKTVESVGLAGYEKYYPHQLSGGMQQRVNLARALVTQPALCLMDEPFGALDAFTREALQDMLLSLAESDDRVFVFVTHDISEAVFLGDRVVALANAPGRISEVVRVELPRPRTRDLFASREFNEYVLRLRALLIH